MKKKTHQLYHPTETGGGKEVPEIRLGPPEVRGRDAVFRTSGWVDKRVRVGTINKRIMTRRSDGRAETERHLEGLKDLTVRTIYTYRHFQ